MWSVDTKEDTPSFCLHEVCQSVYIAVWSGNGFIMRHKAGRTASGTYDVSETHAKV